MPFRSPKRLLPAISSVLAVTAAVAIPLGGADAFQRGSSTADASRTQLLSNGGFEVGTRGWAAAPSDHTSLSGSEVAHRGSAAARLLSTGAGRAVLTDRPNSTTGADRSAYLLRAWVRTARPGHGGKLAVIERRGGHAVGSATAAFRLDDRRWHRVRLPFRTSEAGTRIDVRVVAYDRRAGDRFYVDDVSLRRTSATASGTVPMTPAAPAKTEAPSTSSGGSSGNTDPSGPSTPAKPDSSQPSGSTPTKSPAPSVPSTSTPSTPVTTPKPAVEAPSSSNCTFSTRGIPSCGALLGAGYGGNTDPASWEKEMGHQLGVHRTYFRADQVDYAVRTVQDDLAHGRMPWISFKLPYSWQDMAAGKGDAWARDLSKRLSQVNGPVWLAFHHEPEGDGDIMAWKAMQERLGPIVRSSAPNVAFTVILTGWNELYGGPEFSLDRIWPRTKVDVAGFDIYLHYGLVKNGQKVTKWTNLRTDYFEKISSWAKRTGVAWGLGETGYTDEAHQKDPLWISKTYSDLEATGGVAFAYFNSTLNSIGSWSLSSKSKRDAFTRALSGTPTLDPAG